MENHHFQWENQLLTAIFNSYVKLREGNSSNSFGLDRSLSAANVPLGIASFSSTWRRSASAQEASLEGPSDRGRSCLAAICGSLSWKRPKECVPCMFCRMAWLTIYINLLISFMSASWLLASSCYCSVVTGIGVVFVALSTRDDVPVLLSMSICTIVCALFVVVDIVCCGPSH